jgi:hypothetical protein
VGGQGPYKAAISVVCVLRLEPSACLPAPQGWNPFFNNEKKTIEAYLLHQFDRYYLPWLCLQRFPPARTLSVTLPQRLLRRAHAFDSRALFAA